MTQILALKFLIHLTSILLILQTGCIPPSVPPKTPIPQTSSSAPTSQVTDVSSDLNCQNRSFYSHRNLCEKATHLSCEVVVVSSPSQNSVCWKPNGFEPNCKTDWIVGPWTPITCETSKQTQTRDISCPSRCICTDFRPQDTKLCGDPDPDRATPTPPTTFDQSQATPTQTPTFTPTPTATPSTAVTTPPPPPPPIVIPIPTQTPLQSASSPYCSAAPSDYLRRIGQSFTYFPWDSIAWDGLSVSPWELGKWSSRYERSVINNTLQSKQTRTVTCRSGCDCSQLRTTEPISINYVPLKECGFSQTSIYPSNKQMKCKITHYTPWTGTPKKEAIFYTNCASCQEAFFNYADNPDFVLLPMIGKVCYGVPRLNEIGSMRWNFMIETLASPSGYKPSFPLTYYLSDCETWTGW